MSSIISLTIRRDRVRAGRVGMNPHRNLPQPMLDLCALLPTKNFDRELTFGIDTCERLIVAARLSTCNYSVFSVDIS